MADLTTQPSVPHTDAEDQAALAVYLAETQRLLDQMQAEQAEIDRLKQKSYRHDVEIEALKIQRQEILTRLEAII